MLECFCFDYLNFYYDEEMISKDLQFDFRLASSSLSYLPWIEQSNKLSYL